ncbi:TIGR04255 family protein [Paraburkholderia sediminicola]|uniref:TIGR04255 family protein n=1 Tax=Paraburkholderia sediminicola TaxID=458836 RepID=UPI0038BBCDC0
MTFEKKLHSRTQESVNGDIIDALLCVGQYLPRGNLLATMTITFDDPPLNEVALGKVFLPRPDFLIPYFGAFWELVREEFPKVGHAPPIIGQQSGESGTVELLALPLPRVWLLSDDSVRLIQLQQNRFHYNWRKAAEDVEYPRFAAVQKDCSRLWELFESFVDERTGQPLQLVHSELTYVNLIDVEDSESPFAAAERVLRDPAWTDSNRFLPRPAGFSHSYSFEVPDDVGVLNVSTLSIHKRDGGKALRLELTIQSKQHEGMSFDEWSNRAHDFLVAAFKDLTAPEMHKVWKLRGD